MLPVHLIPALEETEIPMGTPEDEPIIPTNDDIYFFKNAITSPLSTNITPNQTSSLFPTPNIVLLDDDNRAVINTLSVEKSLEFILSSNSYG